MCLLVSFFVLVHKDAMQRGALVPLSMWAHDQQKQPKDIRILEVACGTGRFATFVRDNYPQSDLTLVDLSPFYLEAARENMAYWYTQLPGVNLRMRR